MYTRPSIKTASGFGFLLPAAKLSPLAQLAPSSLMWKKMIMRFHKAMTTLERARSPFCQFANTVDSGMFATVFLVHIEIVVW